jgi:rare lipoprotein A
MRPQGNLRARRACAATVAFGLAYLVCVSAAGAAAPRQSIDLAWRHQQRPLPARLGNDHPLGYGKRLTVAGDLGGAYAGVPVLLEYRPGAVTAGRRPTQQHWAVLAHGAASHSGAYRVSTRLWHSGAVRVAVAGFGGLSPFASTAMAAPLSTASAAMPVLVRARIHLRHARLAVLGAGRAAVVGSLVPARAGLVIDMQLRTPKGWRTVARAATGAQGRYRLSYAPGAAFSEDARLRFNGDRANAPAQRMLGRLNSYELAESSWYGGDGTTACGEHLTDQTLGVANKTLPCGTIVTLRYAGHTVRVPVIDRGPYVAGRSFDLTYATKQALGFGDTGAVWSTAI